MVTINKTLNNQNNHYGFKGSFEKGCIDWCYTHLLDPEHKIEAHYHLRMFKEAAKRKKLEAKRWKQIATELEYRL